MPELDIDVFVYWFFKVTCPTSAWWSFEPISQLFVDGIPFCKVFVAQRVDAADFMGLNKSFETAASAVSSQSQFIIQVHFRSRNRAKDSQSVEIADCFIPLNPICV